VRDLYSVLGLDRFATVDDIKVAYKQKLKEYHPDKINSEVASRLFGEVIHAYEVLSCPDERFEYDREFLTHALEAYVTDIVESGQRLSGSLIAAIDVPDKDGICHECAGMGYIQKLTVRDGSVKKTRDFCTTCCGAGIIENTIGRKTRYAIKIEVEEV